MEITDFGRIRNAQIEMNRINVVGGVNASGKSTASKLLYSFLKANSQDRDNYILSKIIPDLNYIISYIINPHSKKYDMEILQIDSSIKEVLTEYMRQRDIIYEILKIKNLDLAIRLRLNTTVPVMEAYMNNNNEFLSSYCLNSLLCDESLIDFAPEDLEREIRKFGFIRFYNESFESTIHNDMSAEFQNNGQTDIFLGNVNEWESEGYCCSTKGEMNNIKNVFYIGSISFFDLDSYVFSPNFQDYRRSFAYDEHMQHLINTLNREVEDINLSLNLINILKRIHTIIDGNFENFDYLNFSFTQNKADIPSMNVSSGIKQIGVLQMLLLLNKISEGSVLIFDEPEVNLHPDWQFKFAEILVLLAKELNITIYLNSHSPTFIESIDAFVEFYDLEEDVNYYLTEKCGDKYDFTKIGSNELYRIYNNLGNVYHEINKLRIRKRMNSR